MSADQEKLNQLVEKIDELLSVLKDVSEDLKSISASIKSLAVTQITAKPASPPPAPRTPAQVPRQASPGIPSAAELQSVEEIHMKFPPELDSMLVFEDKGDYVMVKPRGFLGSENFAKIASTVRGLGGEYISAGRDSHFRVYKKKP